MTKYLFYDDETASSNQYICSVGYVCTNEDGLELERCYELIDPECEFGIHEVGIHGITAEKVTGKMTFKEFCERSDFLQKLQDYVFVAHNAKSADLSHIKKSLEHYGLKLPPVQVIDTLQEAQHIRGLASYSLEALCDYYDIILEEHHNALRDAEACRDVFWSMQNDFGGTIQPEYYESGEVIYSNQSMRRHAGGLGYVNDSNQTVEELLEEFAKLGQLYYKEDVVELGPCKICFSGTLAGMTKNDIKGYLESNDYRIQPGVGKKTCFLAVGDNVGQSKIKKAKDYKIPIISIAALLDALG